MSNFDDEKDYSLDYFASKNKDLNDVPEPDPSDDEDYGLDALSSSLEDVADDGAFSAGEDDSKDDGEVDFNTFGKKRKEVESDVLKARKAKIKRILKTAGKTTLSLMLIAVITGCLVVGAFAVYVFNFVDYTVYEDLDQLKLDFTTTLYIMDEKTGEYVEYQRLPGVENRIWIGFDEIPQDLKNAFVAVEDQHFYTHNGVDWKRTAGAFADMFVDIYKGRQGGSTITQQLVKNLTDDWDQSAMRKIREIMRARYLESQYEKDTILECYLNTICLANGIYGAEVAANYYFGKPASELTLVECASLASLAKEPEKYRPDKNPENNKTRRNLVLSLMHDQGYISDEEYEAAKTAEIAVVADKSAIKGATVNNYFVDTVIDEVVDRLVEEYNFDEAYAAKNFYNGGYKIYCTVNPDVQKALEAEYAKTDKYFYSKSRKDGSIVQSGMTVMDYSGHIVGIVGGGGEKAANRELNRATMTFRQPGSTIKPLASYSQALQKNLITYSSILEDSPIEKYYYPSGEAGPKNWFDSYLGNVTVATALERSINTIPCKLVKEMGVRSTYNFLDEKFGLELDGEDDMNLSSLGLGGTNSGITVTESAAAFAVFGNLGHYYEPTTFTKVTDQHDNVILEQKKGWVAMDENTACIMNHLLQNVVYGSNGTGDVAKKFSDTMVCYAKTGTSTNANDCWFVGGTPYYVASCWFGYDTPAAVSPSSLAKNMWTNVMKAVHKDLEPKQFTESEFVTKYYYCANTGELATDMCEHKLVGYYKTNYSLPILCTAHPGNPLPPIVDNPIEGANPGGTLTPGVPGTDSSVSSGTSSGDSSSSKPDSGTTSSDSSSEDGNVSSEPATTE